MKFLSKQYLFIQSKVLFVLFIMLISTNCSLAHASTFAWAGYSLPNGMDGMTDVTSSSDGTHLAAVGTSGSNEYLFTSSDSGKTWTQATTTNSFTWNGVVSSNDGTHLLAWGAPNSSQTGTNIYTSTDSGVTWTEQTGQNSNQFWGQIVSSADGTHYLGVAIGFLYVSSDGGQTWSRPGNSPQKTWRSVATSADGSQLVAVDSSGDIYISTNSGTTWTQHTINSAVGNWTAVTSSADGSHLAIADNSGDIYSSTDNGANWTDQTNSGAHSWTALSSSADGSKLIAIGGGTNKDLYVSLDSGNTWTHESSAGSKKWQAVSFSGDGKSIAAAVALDTYQIYSSLSPITLITLESPNNNSTYGGASVQFTASSSGSGGIIGVTPYIDNTSVGTAATSATTEFSGTFNTTGLLNGTHNFYVVAENAYGTQGVPGSFATSSQITLNISNPPITSISSGVPNQTSATITWNTLTDYSTSQVIYGLSSAYTATSSLSTATTTSHSITLQNLSPNTTYHYAVLSTDDIGNQATSSDQTFTTASVVYGGGGGSSGSSGSSGSGGGGGGGGGGSSNTANSAGCVGGNLFNIYTGVRCAQGSKTGTNTVTGTNTTSANSSNSLNSSNTSSATSGYAGPWHFTRLLAYRSRSVDVLHLQQYLNAAGFIIAKSGNGSPGHETNYFGVQTVAALKAFQKFHGIKATGMLGVTTRDYINAHPL